MPNKSCAVVVLGMGRSGTSLLTKGLNSCGIFLGDNLMGAGKGNPKGHFEDLGIVGFNERLLASYNLTWHSFHPLTDNIEAVSKGATLFNEAKAYIENHFLDQPLWGFKDPRTIGVLSFWIKVLESCDVDIKFVLAIRNPRSVAKSLLTRDNMDFNQSYLLWLAYTLPNFDLITGYPFVVVDYDIFLDSPLSQLSRVFKILNLPLKNENRLKMRNFASEFVDRSLRHSSHSLGTFSNESPMEALCLSSYRLLRQLAGADSVAAQESLLPDTKREFDDIPNRMIVASSLHERSMSSVNA